MLDGNKMTEIPGWPEKGRTDDLIAFKGSVYGLVRDSGKVEFSPECVPITTIGLICIS